MITIVKIIYSDDFGNVLEILKSVLLTSISSPSEVLDVQASSFSFATLSTILSLTTNAYNELF
jgi:hypothetical protein